jgi:hypothetical protein
MSDQEMAVFDVFLREHEIGDLPNELLLARHFIAP